MYRQEQLEQALEKILYEPTVGDAIELKARVDEMLAYAKVVTEMSQKQIETINRYKAVFQYHELCEVCGRHYSEHEAGEEGVCEYIQEDAIRQAGNIVEAV